MHLWLIASVVMYVYFDVGLFSLGAKYADAKAKGEADVGQFPEGYFTMLSVQLFPLAITGFILGDPYIIGTRCMTLVVVLFVYGMITSASGQFDSARNRRWVAIWLSIAMLAPMFWAKYEEIRTFVHDFEFIIAWSSVAIMIVFVAKGQLSVAVSLFKHFLAGNYTVKRVKLQWARLFGFVFQGIHYGYIGSGASPVTFWGFELDPIATQGWLGAGGVAFILILAGFGALVGSRARQHKKHDEMRLMADLQRA